MKKLIIAVDFDGTLVEDKWPEIGEAILPALALVKQWRDTGHSLILWTCRHGKELADAVGYLHTNFGITFDKVNENIDETVEKYGCNPRKITADIYFDDRSAKDWREALYKAIDEEGELPLLWQKKECLEGRR